MSNLSELLPSGGGQNVVEFTASGAVASGKPVILNANGTVTEVSETSVSSNVGTETTFESAQTNHISSAYDSTNNKTLIAYRDSGNSGYGTAVVATISGTSISFGTPVVFASESVTDTSTTFDTNAAKFVIVYTGLSSDGKGIVGTVSGTSVSFGSATTFDTGNVSYKSIKYNAAEQVSVVGWKSESDNRGRCRVVTVSGTSVSFGSDSTFETSVTAYVSVGYDSTNERTVVFWRDQTAQRGRAVVATISGTNISYNTEVVFSGSTDALYITSAFDESTGKFVVSYRGTSNFGQSVVGTVSGTDISFGTAVTFKGQTVEYLSSDYDATAQKVVIAYRNDSAIEGQIISGKVSGTSITFDTEDTFKSGSSTYTAVSYDSSAGKNSVAYTDNASLSYGDGFVYTTGYIATNLTATNFIGLASAAISDTATGDINVKGGINEVASPALATGSETNLTGKTQSPYPVITYDITNSKFVVFFQDGNNSNYGTSVVVTVSGTTVTFGTPVVFNSGSTNYIDATYSESNGKHLVVYPDYGNSQQATAIVGTVSGTSISFGSEQVYDTGTVNTRVSVAYNSNLDKYLAGSTPSSGTINVTVLTVSGTTVSVGTPVSLSGTKYLPNIASNESASDFVLGNNKNDNQSEAHLISVSGTVPTVEASTDLSAVVSSSFPRTGLAFLESNKFVCVYSDNSTNSMYTRTITVSGTSLSLGTASSAFTVDPNPQTNINGAWPLFKATTTSAYLYYQDDTSNYLKYVPISISGTTATSGTEVTYTSQTSDYEGFFYSADAKQGLSFFQSTDSGQQTAAIAQSGVFAIGSDYYVQSDGTISTTSTSPAVKIGQAITATTINMMDLT